MTESAMIQLATEDIFCAAAVMDVKDIVIDPDFRRYCEANVCGHYGADYSCPPDCGSVEELRSRLQAHRRALVFQSKWPITDYSDKEAIRQAKTAHNTAMLRIIDQLRDEGHSGLMCGASSCTLCQRCAILDGAPCRDPERRFSCLSAYCIFVKKLAESCGMEYLCADGSIAFFGLYAF